MTFDWNFDWRDYYVLQRDAVCCSLNARADASRPDEDSVNLPADYFGQTYEFLRKIKQCATELDFLDDWLIQVYTTEFYETHFKRGSWRIFVDASVTIAQWRRARDLTNLGYLQVPGSIPAENPGNSYQYGF